MILREKARKSIEIAGDGETKYRFTFTRFSATDRQRQIFREEIAKAWTASELGLNVDDIKSLLLGIDYDTKLDRKQSAILDIVISAIRWARITSGLVLLEHFDGTQWYPQSIPADWNTPSGFLDNFESFGEIYDLDQVALDLNRDLFGATPDDEQKKKEELNTGSSSKTLTDSQSQPATTNRKQAKKKSLRV